VGTIIADAFGRADNSNRDRTDSDSAKYEYHFLSPASPPSDDRPTARQTSSKTSHGTDDTTGGAGGV
jgi:hypothetical protein